MPKGKILEDSFEQLVELGQSTAKQTVKAVASTVSPSKIAETVFGVNSNSSETGDKLKEKLKNKKNNHTPLDFEKLQKNYDKNDDKKTNVLRQHLFNLVRRSEEKLLYEEKQKKMERLRRETYEKEEKNKKEEKKKQEQSGSLPKGKLRQSIFAPKKVAQREHAEVKPASGKQ